MNDDDLEAMFRESLHRHADDVRDQGGHAEAAHAGVRRRRRRILTGVVAAAAVVVLAPVAVVAANQGGREATSAGPREGHPSGWRVESYNGVELRVPPSWGWGVTPTLGRPGWCDRRTYPLATSYDDIRFPRPGNRPIPYVGRPMPPSKGCNDSSTRQAPHVWFDSPLAVGTVPGSGTTVRVHGLTTFNITVLAPNSSETRIILGSIRSVGTDDNGCPRRPVPVSDHQASVDPESAEWVSVCMYYRDAARASAPGSAEHLYYSTALLDRAPRLLRSILSSGPHRGPVPLPLCIATSPSRIDLVFHSGDDARTFSVNLSQCDIQPVEYDDGAGRHLLTKRSVRLWAVNGISAYTSPDSRLTSYLPR